MNRQDAKSAKHSRRSFFELLPGRSEGIGQKTHGTPGVAVPGDAKTQEFLGDLGALVVKRLSNRSSA
jgi:hypothetical protein